MTMPDFAALYLARKAMNAPAEGKPNPSGKLSPSVVRQLAAYMEAAPKVEGE